MKKTIMRAGAVVLALITLTGCGEYTSQDRSEEAGGRQADEYSDASDVVVWRNIDNAPNVVTFCAGGVKYASTLSADGTRAPSLVVLPEDLQTCGR